MSHLPFVFNSRDDARPMRFYSRDDGYQIVFLESGSDATGDTSFYEINLNGDGATVASTTTQSKTGPRSLKFDVDSTTDVAYAEVNFPDANAVNEICIPGPGMRVSFYVRFSGFPAVEANSGALFFGTGPSAQPSGLSVDNSGVLRLLLGDNSLKENLSGNGPTLSTDTWYRICYAHNIIGPGLNDFRVYVDGVLGMSVKNWYRKNFEFNGRFIGMVLGYLNFAAFASPLTMFMDDIYVDTNPNLLDTGDIRVTNKRPASNNVNNFAVAIGANPSDRWENVDEVPLSTTNGWLDNVDQATINENYGIQVSSSGDVDISSYTGSYPSALPAAGVSTAWSGGLYLYECGVHVAINSNNGTIVASKPWAYLASSSPNVNGGIVEGDNKVYLYLNGSAVSLNHSGANRPRSPDGQTMSTTPHIFFQFFDTGNVLKPFRFYSRD